MRWLRTIEIRGPALERELEAARRALPGARARAEATSDTRWDRDQAASASGAYGLTEAATQAILEVIEELSQDSTEYWVRLPRGCARESARIEIDDSGALRAGGYTLYSDHAARPAWPEDIRPWALLAVYAEDPFRPMGTGLARAEEGAAS